MAHQDFGFQPMQRLEAVAQDAETCAGHQGSSWGRETRGISAFCSAPRANGES